MSTFNSGTGGEWPVTEGRYKIGNKDSPVAVCSMATMDMELPMEKIAILGKCVTENVGIEKIIKNIISNPKIRYLVMCGKVSAGHFVGQALKSLKENGVDSGGRIIGASGSIPVLKNTTKEEIDIFRKKIEVIDMEGELNTEKIMEKVDEYFKTPPGSGIPVVSKEPGKVSVQPVNGWVQDQKGFFTILVKEGNEIVVEYYDAEKKLVKVLSGKKAEDMYKNIIKMEIVSSHFHSAYLGKELCKAEIAMQNKINYEQDKPLNFNGLSKPNPVAKPTLPPSRLPLIPEGRVIKDGIKQEMEDVKNYASVLRKIRVDSFFVGGY